MKNPEIKIGDSAILSSMNTSDASTTTGCCPDTYSAVSVKFHAGDGDDASLCSSPSSFKVRLRNTFLDFKKEDDQPIPGDLGRSRAESHDSLARSPLRRSQSDLTGVDDYIRLRLGSNAGVVDDVVEFDGDSLSPAGRISPMSCLARKNPNGNDRPVSILSFSPPTFRPPAFSDLGEEPADFEMIMEEVPIAPSFHLATGRSRTFGRSCESTQPNTPTVAVSTEPVPCSGDDRTTVMLRNIPNKYTQRMLLSEVNSLGFEGQYDFFYLPIDYRYVGVFPTEYSC